MLTFLAAWKPELEFLPQHVPERPPLWLDAVLQLPSTSMAPPPPLPSGPADWAATASAARLLPREPHADGSDHAGSAFDSHGSEHSASAASGLGLSLDALAIEGLTMGPARHRNLVPHDDLDGTPRLPRDLHASRGQR